LTVIIPFKLQSDLGTTSIAVHDVPPIIEVARPPDGIEWPPLIVGQPVVVAYNEPKGHWDIIEVPEPGESDNIMG
jgi:hypothetical protein